jgi:hypothetical protein
MELRGYADDGRALAPQSKLSPDEQGYAGEVVLKVAKAKEIVHAACGGRDDVRPIHFAVDSANGT